jgi:probable F420-dependent oxidoreductase
VRLGLGVGGSLADVQAEGRAAEAAGFESAWVAELGHSAFVQAAAAIGATERLLVGTAVALAFPRSPTIAAMEARDLAALSGGRFLLGLGAQVRRVVEARYSVPYDAPAAQLADYVAAIRAVWAAGRGEAVTHDGPFYRIAMPTFHEAADPDAPLPPILIAAVGAVMSRTAGLVADGLVGHPLASPAYLREVIVPAVAGGLIAAGRRPDACPISASPLVAIGSDPDRVRRAAKLQLAFYATTRQYAGILRLHGREAVMGEVRRAFVRRDRDRMVAAIDDELLDAIAIAGRPDELRDRLAAWEGVAARAILAPPWYGVDPGERRDMTAAIVVGVRPTGSG